MTTIILRMTITKTNFAAQVCHDQCPVRCRGPPQEPTQKREPLHTTGECDDDVMNMIIIMITLMVMMMIMMLIRVGVMRDGQQSIVCSLPRLPSQLYTFVWGEGLSCACFVYNVFFITSLIKSTKQQ